MPTLFFVCWIFRFHPNSPSTWLHSLHFSLIKKTNERYSSPHEYFFFHYNNHNWRLCNFYEFWVRRICDANCISLLLTLKKYKFSREKSCRFMRHSRVTMSVWNWTNGLKISLRWLLISQQQRSCMEYGKIQITRVSAAGCTHNLIQFFPYFYRRTNERALETSHMLQ